MDIGGHSALEQESNQTQDSWIPEIPSRPISQRTKPIYDWRRHGGILVGASGENTTLSVQVPSLDSASSSEPNRETISREAVADAGVQVPRGSTRGSLEPMAGWNNIPFVQLLAQATSGHVMPSMNATTMSLSVPMPNSHIVKDRIRNGQADSADYHDASSGPKELNSRADCSLPTSHGEHHKTFRQTYDLNSPPEIEAEDILSRTSQFVPVTPDQSKALEREQSPEIPKSCPEERANQGSHEAYRDITPKRIETSRTRSEEELLHADSSSAAVTTPVKNHIAENGSTGLTTPQQKPRRRRHRPKVITEGKPKRIPKKETPKPSGSLDNPTGKRKYVRRKGLNSSSTTPATRPDGEKINQPMDAPKRRSTKRSLNFDLEGQVRDGSSLSRPDSNVNTAVQVQHPRSDETQPNITVHVGQGMEVPITNSGSGIAYELTRSINQLIKDYISSPASINPSSPAVTKANTPEHNGERDSKFEDSLRRMDEETADDKGKAVEILSCYDIHSVHQTSNSSSSALNMPMGEVKRNKKGHSQKINREWPSTTNYTDEEYNSIQDHLELQVDFMHFPDIFKKKRTERGQSPTTSRASSKTTARNTLRMAKHCLQYVAEKDQIAPTANGWNSATQSNVTAPNTGVSGITQEGFQTMLTMGPARWTKKRSKGPTRVRDLSSLSGIAGNSCPLTSMASQPPLHDAQGVKTLSRQTCMESLVSEMHKTMAKGKRSKKRNAASNFVSSGANIEHLHQKNMQYNQSRFLSQSIAPPPDMISDHLVAVDALVDRLKQLDINWEGKLLCQQWSAIVPYNVRHQSHQAIVSYDVGNQESNALVVYGQNGPIVPYDGSSYHIKKRRPRAKVDLDDETHRVWKLLLENINNEGIDGTDEEKAQWWEEERRVFHGRVDSFIARMHLVQGDRRFSQWKGSIVDSVIGVFLTQNVSDHLSSSAFMSLASHFPLKPKNCEQASHEEVTAVLNTEPEVCILDPVETITWKEHMSNNQVCGHIFMTNSAENNDENGVSNSSENDEIYDSSSEVLSSPENSKCRIASLSEQHIFLHPTENSSVSKTLCRGTTCVIEGDKRTMEDVVSSQDSVVSYQSSPDSSFAQITERIGLYSESISTEPKCDSPGKSTSFVKLLQMAETPMFYGNLSPQSSHVQDDQSLNEVRTKTKGSYDQQGQTMDTLGDPQSSLGLTGMQERMNHFSENHFNPDGVPDNVGALHCGQDDKGHQHLVMQNSTREVKDATESTSTTNNQKATEQAVISKSKKTTYSSDRAFYESNMDALKAKKRRVGRDFNHAFDWDSLRKQAQNNRKRERTANTMDSLDYEAMRRADVSEIAETIKERGMNNMLAERMKDFLNRLVREHGSINLEWLRDIPPDKAKEYLLSIRGLGLKSVECVRLLTLHHLAFPVDTNVGRIAVRLGWVPLQPLPESLQLHLLEMYPVMESIQKYLWPRLCKLDQRTLYELHYQMITFGKVFCTKSKPNCNACPMRGECRHFASAFASARLALPGPEEKSIVRRTESIASDHDATMMPNPLQLPPALTNKHAAVHNQLEINQEPEAQSEAINCEPIIEEPKTPEPEIIQLTESDIEDAGYEDPDEIPTIKLNIEQFTQNLQNYMQKNMEIQEGDVSKALVALTPEAASIPTPKLKNVSRLRTEHQVYELPDSHPLLDGLDKREPDDPCSYLLAIWTPGETANSIQPSEGKCCSQEFGKLCDENTCFACSSSREANSQTVRGTLLIPCRTAMRGSFPLNGTYFQVNEVFADHDSSLNPIDVPRNWIWNLPRRTVYFGTSVPTIFKGLSTQGIQYCFWRGFVCVRGFDQKTRAPRPLMARLHFPASKLSRSKGNTKNEQPVPQPE